MTCPCCNGVKHVGILFICPIGAQELTCPYCAGAGDVSEGRMGWRVIGQNLRRAREACPVQIGDDRGRWVFTVDDTTPIIPMPLYAAAHLLQIPEAMLTAIENGEFPPERIALQAATMLVSWA